MHGSIHTPDAINFFKSIGANPRLVNLLEEGYKIPFSSHPEPFWQRNNQSAIQNIDFVFVCIPQAPTMTSASILTIAMKTDSVLSRVLN